MVEMQEQRRGGAAEAAVADADVEDRAGGFGQPVPHAGVLQQAARAGGDGVGAAVERRVLHRRQRGAVHHHGGDARPPPAGRPACRRPGRRRRRTPRPTDARLMAADSGAGRHSRRQAMAVPASAIRRFRHIVAHRTRTAGQRVTAAWPLPGPPRTRRLASPDHPGADPAAARRS